MTRYSCSFRGQCEVNRTGEYQSLEDCQRECQGRDASDLNYLIYQYSPDTAVEDLAPSDQREVLRRLTTLDSDDQLLVTTLLDAFGDDGYDKYGFEELYPYFESQGLLTDENLARSLSSSSIAKLMERYPNGIPERLLRLMGQLFIEEKNDEEFGELYEQVSDLDREALVSGILTDYVFDMPPNETVNRFVITRLEVFRALLQFYRRETDLPFILEAWTRYEDDEAFDEFFVENTIGEFATYPLFARFIWGYHGYPFFGLILDRNDVVFLDQVLHDELYPKYVIEEDLITHVEEGFDINAMMRGVLERYGIAVPVVPVE